MIITQDTDESHYKIKSYSSGQIKINNETYSSSLIISADKLIVPWPIDMAHLTPNTFEFIYEFNCLLFLFGTGETQRFPSLEILKFFAEAKIGLECMTTPAACRTFTVLASEKRKVVAGLVVE